MSTITLSPSSKTKRIFECPKCGVRHTSEIYVESVHHRCHPNSRDFVALVIVAEAPKS